MTKRLAETTAPMDRAIGQRIRDLRILRGFSQERLADGLGITFQQVQKYEKGVNRVAVSTMLLIARTLQVQLAEIIGAVEGTEPSPEQFAIGDLLRQLRAQNDKLAKVRRALGDDESGSDAP